jgi:hypothetical protein
MLVTLSGIVMEVNPVQLRKDSFPMLVRPFPSVIDVKPNSHRKHIFDAGDAVRIVMEVNPVQPRKRCPRYW